MFTTPWTSSARSDSNGKLLEVSIVKNINNKLKKTAGVDRHELKGMSTTCLHVGVVRQILGDVQ